MLFIHVDRASGLRGSSFKFFAVSNVLIKPERLNSTNLDFVWLNASPLTLEGDSLAFPDVQSLDWTYRLASLEGLLNRSEDREGA